MKKVSHGLVSVSLRNHFYFKCAIIKKEKNPKIHKVTPFDTTCLYPMSSFEPVLDEEEEDSPMKRREEDEDDDIKEEEEEEEEDDNHSLDNSNSSSEEDDEDSVVNQEEEEMAQLTDENAVHRQRLGLYDEEDDDENTRSGDNYLKKFDSSMRFTMMEQYHPELLMENNTDVLNKTQIQRNEDGTISDPHHRTLPMLTKYEKARILGERAKQLNAGAKPMVDVDDSVVDGYIIALEEFHAKKIPFIIKRPLCNGECEYWKFCDLEII